jgi:hypothetical protein
MVRAGNCMAIFKIGEQFLNKRPDDWASIGVSDFALRPCHQTTIIFHRLIAAHQSVEAFGLKHASNCVKLSGRNDSDWQPGSYIQQILVPRDEQIGLACDGKSQNWDVVRITNRFFDDWERFDFDLIALQKFADIPGNCFRNLQFLDQFFSELIEDICGYQQHVLGQNFPEKVRTQTPASEGTYKHIGVQDDFHEIA